MAKSVSSLYKICLESVARFLKSNVWNISYEFCDSFDNPFDRMPSVIIDELITCVARLSVSSLLKNTDLYHLIATGRVRNFKLEDIGIKSDDILSILMHLSSKCQNLISIKLKNVFCSNNYAGALEKTSMKSNALECVLSLAPRLESVESCIEFNLKSLRNAERLKQLKLNFVPKMQLFDFLEEANEQFWPNSSLRVLEVFEDVRHPLSYLDIAVILRYCTELVEINCDISRSLEYLHAEELYNGTLAAQYKLEKCHMGSIFLEVPDAAVTRDGVYIASLTCPFLKEIEVLVHDDGAIHALCDFPNLHSLLLQWEALTAGYFEIGTTSLLEKVGPNLKMLHIVNFSNVDFSLIGILCPNLEELRVEYTTERNSEEFSPSSFQHVSILHIETIDDSYCQSASLIGLLSNCTELKLLSIQPAQGFTDASLDEILKRNSLSNLKEARIYNCSLSAAGVQECAARLTSLEYFEISSSEISFDEIVAIVHEINPQIIMSYITFE